MAIGDSKNPKIPVSDKGELVPLVGTRALAVTVDATVSAATDVTLQTTTKMVRVFAKDNGIYVRGQATASAANWDWFVPANQMVDIVIPASVTVLSFIEETASAKLILAEY